MFLVKQFYNWIFNFKFKLDIHRNIYKFSTINLRVFSVVASDRVSCMYGDDS